MVPRNVTIVAAFAMACGAGCATPSPTIDISAEPTFDGLFPVQNSAADRAWAREGLDLSVYTKIKLESIGVEYRPDVEASRMWTMRRSSGGPFEITPEARERFEVLIAEVFLEELSQGERFSIVDEAGPDVLLVRGGLLDVVSFVPPDRVGMNEVFLRSVGEATLVLEIRDSLTNTILARSIDRHAAEAAGQDLSWSNPVSNAAEVRRLARRWATRLREGLDAFMGPR